MSTIFSVSLFFLSFTPLWVSILFIDVKSIINGGEICTEILSVIAILLLSVFCGFIVWNALRSKLRSGEKKYKLTRSSEEKSISAEYLLSYILPLFAFDFTQWDNVILFMIFWVTLAFLCVRHNYFSVNVLLELLQYRFYDCELENEDGIAITKKVITQKHLEIMVGTDITLVSVNNEYSVHCKERN